VNRLPAGTVTFLFADIEASTRLLQQLGDRPYANLLAEYRQVLRGTFHEGQGYEVDAHGDAFFASFSRAQDAILSAIAAQRAIVATPWPDGIVVRLRMGLHTGEPVTAGTSYVGMDVHLAARICTCGHGGQILLSRATAHLIEHELPKGTGLKDLGEHRLKDLARAHHIYQLVARGLPADFPPLKSLGAYPNNLPIQLTSFIGRAREVAEVKQLLTSNRLITLTGVGGTGKTRLALQVAADVLEDFTHGVWVVELADLTDPALVPLTLASVLGISQLTERRLLDILVDAIRSRQLLLVFDNCEHLLSACAELADTLLRSCPEVRILTTSREGLRIGGEILYPVPPLPVPIAPLPPPEKLLQYDAVRLFIERGITRLPTLALTRQNARSIADVCTRLDGIPLAIELAAARINTMGMDELVTRLNDRFRLLTGGSRSALPRHQTLRAAMDWSYDQLSTPEQVLLRRLSVFAGGFTLEAAEAICANEDVQTLETLDLLSRLVDKSLVLAEQHGQEMRYRLLETVRQYSREKLAPSESDSLRERHLQFFLRTAEQAEPQLQKAGQQAGLERLEIEHDNLRAALEWSKVRAGTEVGLRLAGALSPFWSERGYWREGRGWLEGALANSPQGSPARGKALYGAGYLAWRLGDYESAVRLSEESLALCRTLGDKWGLAFSLLNLGVIARYQDHYERAEALHEESLALFRELGSLWGVAWSLRLLGIVLWYRGSYVRAGTALEESLALSRAQDHKGNIAAALHSLGRFAAYQGEDERAAAFLNEGLTLFQALGSQEGIVSSLHMLGRIAGHQGDHERARTVVQESLEIVRQLGSEWSTADVLNTLAQIEAQQANFQQARALLLDSLAIRRKLGYGWDKRGLANCLDGFAAVSAAQDQPAHAARLSARAEAIRSAIGAPLPPADRADRDRAVAAIRVRLGEQAFTAAWEAGQVMTLEEAVESAIAGPTT